MPEDKHQRTVAALQDPRFFDLMEILDDALVEEVDGPAASQVLTAEQEHMLADAYVAASAAAYLPDLMQGPDAEELVLILIRRAVLTGLRAGARWAQSPYFPHAHSASRPHPAPPTPDAEREEPGAGNYTTGDAEK